jgi:hypothetical protein
MADRLGNDLTELMGVEIKLPFRKAQTFIVTTVFAM